MEAIIAKVNSLLGKLYPSFLVGKVPEDKFMHFVSGFLITLVLTPFIGVMSLVWLALIALAKEVYDWVNKDMHTPDVMDWVATVLGSAIGFGLFLI